ncbi:MAG: hypothetical protein ACFFD2_02440 [Promethearchaeota archaeon]
MVQLNNFNLTPKSFEKFLLDTILDKIFFCIIHSDSIREYITAIGKLVNEFYLAQIRTDKPDLSNINIIHLTSKLIDKILEVLHPAW